MKMKDKIIKLNMNIEMLVEKILYREMEYLRQGYCPYALTSTDVPRDNCDDCSKCKHDYIDNLRSKYLAKYQIN